MRRRDFITLLGVTAWPLIASAQNPLPLVGYLDSRSAEIANPLLTAFMKGLQEAGFSDGQTARFEYSWANLQLDRLPMLAAALIAHQPTVIAAAGGTDTALAAKRATSSIPIVFVNGGDPVRDGLVGALNQPGGNVTGVSFLATAIVAKRLGLLRAAVPNASKIAVLVNPTNPEAKSMASEVTAAERALGLRLLLYRASSERDLEGAFANMAEAHVDALLIGGDRLFNAWRQKLIALSEHYSFPSMFDAREFAAEGGLMSYGASQAEAYKQAGNYVGRILKGEKPGELPVLQATKFEFVINLKTAKALGLTVPTSMQLLADEVIE